MNWIRFAYNLQAARKAAGKTQEEASEAINVARTTIVAIEQGNRRCKYDEIETLAQWLGMPVGDLTAGCESDIEITRNKLGDDPKHYSYLTETELCLIEKFRDRKWMQAINIISHTSEAYNEQ